MPRWRFIRHGESAANAGGWLAGHRDAPLTAIGEAQARALAERLSGEPVPRVYASDLIRARRTAEIILGARSHALVTSPALRERSAGTWEGLPLADLEPDGRINDVLRQWRTRPPEGESLHDVACRALAWLAGIDDGRDAWIVCHGALMRAVMGVIDDTPIEDIGRLRPGNCEVVDRDLHLGAWARAHAKVLGEP